MDRLNQSLRHFVDFLDINERYDLRRTPSRQERIINELDLHTVARTHNNMSNPNVLTATTSSSATLTTPTTHTTTTHCSSLYNITLRFCGNVPLGTPNRDKLISYDVNRWLADTHTRIAAKGIQDPILKIREAKLAINPDVGDATQVVNTGRMAEMTDFELFKDRCLRLWRLPEDNFCQ